MAAVDLRLRWSPAARRDLKDIWRYYAETASDALADDILRRIGAAGGKAAARPLLYRPRDSVSPGLRAVIVHPYIVYYRIVRREVEVVRVLHERRDHRRVFADKDEKAR